jgi:hypothetical protein
MIGVFFVVWSVIRKRKRRIRMIDGLGGKFICRCTLAFLENVRVV